MKDLNNDNGSVLPPHQHDLKCLNSHMNTSMLQRGKQNAFTLSAFLTYILKSSLVAGATLHFNIEHIPVAIFMSHLEKSHVSW